MPPSEIDQLDPDQTWAALNSGDNAILIDVRTRAEWSFVGAPDLAAAAPTAAAAFIEWKTFPAMGFNEAFVDTALAEIDAAGAQTAYFICRSGARSMQAAIATAAAAAGGTLKCVNVAEGFEGDLNEDGRRGALNGWKARGLPWRQS